MGFSIGADPLSTIRVMLESINDDDYDPNEDYDTDENDFGVVALAAYYKYKPHEKWEFDIGSKFAGISNEEFYYRNDNERVEMDMLSTLSFFGAINYSTRNAFSGQYYNPFFAALETGWTGAPGDLIIHDQQTGEAEVIDNLSGSIYFEIRAGFKFGWPNNAAGLFLAVNNQFNTRSADHELQKRGLRELPNTGPIILIGMNYEFGFRKNKREKRRKSNSETIYPDWFQPEE